MADKTFWLELEAYEGMRSWNMKGRWMEEDG